MNKSVTTSKSKRNSPAEPKPAKQAESKAADAALYESVLRERRRHVRSIPVADVKESDSDSDWAQFS